MKNINYIINGILAVAVIILFVIQFSGRKEENSGVGALTSSEDVGGKTILPIAYINIDSLLTNYNYAKDLNEALLRKEEDSRAAVNEQATQLQRNVADFQRKVQNNAFLSQQRAEQEQQNLMKQEQDLRERNQRLSNEMMVEQQKMNSQLRDSINSFLKEYNKTKQYQVIFSNTMFDNILISSPEYDITKEVVELLNKRYVSKKK